MNVDVDVDVEGEVVTGMMTEDPGKGGVSV